MSDDAWSLVTGWLERAGDRARVLAPGPVRGESIASALRVSERSLLYAMSTHLGALCVDDGWVRVLGGGEDGSRADLASWNGLGDAPVLTSTPNLFIVAFDVLGGVFAMDGGALGGAERGTIHYFAHDSLRWESLDAPYSAWLEWLLTDGDDVAAFYEDFRWPGWRDEVQSLGLDDALHTWPPPWTQEGKDLARVSRKAVPAREVVELAFASARELDGHDVPGPH